ncbi:MAG: GntR family transcriptional regulator [Bryobacteraceae bacterium]|nr:GntR family transcriptional regulator [Bryobacteraceae bacterium]HEU0141043.1 GntR family transcriptional regulator [Bryobacteraceae bacterium]
MARASLPEVRFVSMRASVADTLRQAFLDGYFSPGEDISEVALATQLKVSRGPIRDALLILTQEGLVTHSPNRGFSVLQLTDSDFEHIQNVRLPLEALALTLARGRVSREDVEILETLKEKLMEAFRAGNFSAAARCDLEFHSALWERSGNPWLEAALKRIMVPYFTFTMVYRQKPSTLTEAIIEEQHALYIDYIKGESDKSAEECMRIHLG